MAEGRSALTLWSGVRTFSTALEGGEWNPFRTAEGFAGNVAPPPGANDVPLKPAFQWNSADWATGYEFVLANNSAFANPLVSRTGGNALDATAYLLETELEYITTYYWKVRAISATSQSEWAQGIFTTITPPEAGPPAPPPPPPPPAWQSNIPLYAWTVIAIGAVLVIVVIILIITTRRTRV